MISLGLYGDSNKTSFIEIIQCVFKIGHFSPLKIKNTFSSEFKTLKKEDFKNPLVNKNIEHINKKLIQNPSEYLKPPVFAESSLSQTSIESTASQDSTACDQSPSAPSEQVDPSSVSQTSPSNVSAPSNSTSPCYQKVHKALNF